MRTHDKFEKLSHAETDVLVWIVKQASQQSVQISSIQTALKDCHSDLEVKMALIDLRRKELIIKNEEEQGNEKVTFYSLTSEGEDWSVDNRHLFDLKPTEGDIVF
jgi:hypothetical protein